MITELQKAWLAGIVDMKGRIIYKKNQTRATPQVIFYLESKDLVVIREISKLTGIKIDFQKAKPIKEFMRKSCSEHCPEKHQHVSEYDRPDLKMPPTARWTVTGAALVVVLHNLLPYIMNKKDYPETLAFLRANSAISGRGSGQVLTSIRRLYLLGWKLPSGYEIALD